MHRELLLLKTQPCPRRKMASELRAPERDFRLRVRRVAPLSAGEATNQGGNAAIRRPLVQKAEERFFLLEESEDESHVRQL